MPQTLDATVQATANQLTALKALRDEYEALSTHAIAAPIGQHVDESRTIGQGQSARVYAQKFRFAELEPALGEYAPRHAVGLANGQTSGGRIIYDAVAVFQAMLEQPALPTRENEGQYRLRLDLNALIEDRVLGYLQGLQPLMEGVTGHTRGMWHFRILPDGSVTIGTYRIFLNPSKTMVYGPTDQTAPSNRSKSQVNFLCRALNHARSSSANYSGSVADSIRTLMLASTPGTADDRGPTVTFPTAW